MSICDGCEGDESCQIQWDLRNHEYNCPINSKWVVATEKLEAVKLKLLEWDNIHQRDKHAAPSILVDIFDIFLNQGLETRTNHDG